ncbi:MAG TPA: hypothetical protein VIZ18_19805 [Ktedonobacteraceae bacterium]
MSGFTGNDGSGLVGGLNPSGAVKALSVDASGNLNVNASVSSGPTNITQVSSANVGPTNGLPVSGNNGGSLVVIGVDSSGRLILVPNTAFNLAQIAGVAPGLDNTNELRTSLYGKNAAAGDTPLAVDTSGRMQTANYIGGAAVGNANPYPSADQVRLMILNGQGFSLVQEAIATGGGNAFVGMQIIANSIAKNILLYRAWAEQGQAAGINRLYQALNATADTNLTDTLTPVNNGGVSTASALSSILGKNSLPSQTSGFQGSLLYSGGLAANTTLDLLAQGQCLYIPKNTTGSISIYSKVVTSGNAATIGLCWVEF